MTGSYHDPYGIVSLLRLLVLVMMMCGAPISFVWPLI
jgi:hypothetical protein